MRTWNFHKHHATMPIATCQESSDKRLSLRDFILYITRLGGVLPRRWRAGDKTTRRHPSPLTTSLFQLSRGRLQRLSSIASAARLRITFRETY
jgi:hypothetical protein